AEDGIRDFHVTGVQTCALPILSTSGITSTAAMPVRRGSTPTAAQARTVASVSRPSEAARSSATTVRAAAASLTPLALPAVIEKRSEERRVGRESRSGRERDT